MFYVVLLIYVHFQFSTHQPHSWNIKKNPTNLSAKIIKQLLLPTIPLKKKTPTNLTIAPQKTQPKNTMLSKFLTQEQYKKLKLWAQEEHRANFTEIATKNCETQNLSSKVNLLNDDRQWEDVNLEYLSQLCGNLINYLLLHLYDMNRRKCYTDDNSKDTESKRTHFFKLICFDDWISLFIEI